MLRKITLIIIILLLTISLANAQENIIGIGLFHGENITDSYPIWSESDGYKWSCTIIHPTYGWVMSDKWEVFIEGDLGHYNLKEKDIYSIGISLMTDYMLLSPIYIEAGCGISHWTDDFNKVKRGVIGLIKYGIGTKFNLVEDYTLKVGYRFTHSSELIADDSGANSHGVLVMISKRF